jgi:hypothetical protein
MFLFRSHPSPQPPPPPQRSPKSFAREREKAIVVNFLAMWHFYTLCRTCIAALANTVNSMTKFFIQKHLRSQCSLIAIYIFFLHLEINRNTDPLPSSPFEAAILFFKLFSPHCYAAFYVIVRTAHAESNNHASFFY